MEDQTPLTPWSEEDYIALLIGRAIMTWGMIEQLIYSEITNHGNPPMHPHEIESARRVRSPSISRGTAHGRRAAPLRRAGFELEGRKLRAAPSMRTSRAPGIDLQTAEVQRSASAGAAELRRKTARMRASSSRGSKGFVTSSRRRHRFPALRFAVRTDHPLQSP